jgi:hypothetical protein
MKIIKTILIWLSGFVCGILLLFFLQSSHNSAIEINIENKTNSTIEDITLIEPKFKNSNSFGELKEGDFIKYQLFSTGEITYKVIARLDSIKTLSTEVYSEPGYKDYFRILDDTIIHNPNFGY